MTTTQIVAVDAAMPAEPARALESLALVADLIGSHPSVNASRRTAPMRVPGGYVVSLITVLPKPTATRRVRELIATSTPEGHLFQVSSH